jgi:hypothetical protein
VILSFHWHHFVNSLHLLWFHWQQLLLWIVNWMGYLVVAILLLRKDHRRRWPFFLALCIFHLTQDAFLATQTSVAHYTTYFYTYWYGEIVSSLLTFGVLRDIARSVPGLRFLPRQISIVFITAASVITCGAAALACVQHVDLPRVAVTALTIHRAIAAAWITFAMAMLWGILSLGMRFRMHTLQITTAFLVSGLSKLLTDYGATIWPHQSWKFDCTHTALSSLALAYCAHSLAHSEVVLPAIPLSVYVTAKGLLSTLSGQAPEKDTLA